MPKDSLTKFANILYNEALEEKERVSKKLQAERERTLAEADEELKSIFKRKLQSYRSGLEYELRLSLSRREAELAKTLRQNRARVADEVFAEATKRLIAFTKEAAYEKFLTDEFKGVSASFTKSKTVCSAKSCDVELIRRLCPIENIEIETADDEIIGGFTLKNISLGIFADCTLRTKLEEEKNVFFQTSGLAID